MCAHRRTKGGTGCMCTPPPGREKNGGVIYKGKLYMQSKKWVFGGNFCLAGRLEGGREAVLAY